MAIQWRLKTYLAQSKGIYKAVDFQKRIAKKTGVLISLQNLCNYMNGKPSEIRLKTMELICTALDCQMNDFCTVSPKETKVDKSFSEGLKKLSFKNTPIAKRAIDHFPEPKEYER